MKNILKLPAQSKLKTNLVIFVVLIATIYLINIFTNNLKKQTPPITEPVYPSITPIIPLSKVSPLPTPKLTVKWNDTTAPDIPEKLYEYSLSIPLASALTQNTLPQLLGFSNENKLSIQDKDTAIWSNEKKSLVIKIKDNSIVYSTNTQPPQTGPEFSPQNTQLAAINLIKKLFGENIEPLLTLQNIDYYKTKNVYSSPSSIATADLVRISFYQSIDDFPVLAQSETGAIFTIYLDRNLNLYSLSIKGGFSVVEQNKELTIIPFLDIKNKADIAQRLNASPDLATNFEVASSKNIDLSVENAKIGYLLISDRFLPIYFLEGDISSQTATTQPAIYALPATYTN